MDEIISLWPLLFIIFILISRILNFINSQKGNSNINMEKKVKKNDEKIKIDSENKSFEKPKEFDTYEGYEETEEHFEKKPESITDRINAKKMKRDEAKIQVKAIKKGKKSKLFINKSDIVRGIIMKEVIDKPKFND